MDFEPSFDEGSGGSSSSTSLFATPQHIAPVTPGYLAHDALLYSDVEEYVEGVRTVVQEGAEADEPVLIAVPEPRLGVLRAALDSGEAALSFVDMRHEGRNPGRILPLIRAFADEHAGRGVRLVSEPIWPERAAAEIVEGHRHEALVNLGLAGCDAHIVCPYDTGGLDEGVIAEAARTHPTLVTHGVRHASTDFRDPLEIYAAAGHSLTPAPENTVAISLHEGLVGVRRDIERHVARELAQNRVAELVIAANEAVANTMRHAGGEGAARMWRDDGRVVVEVADRGHITDPFVGRRLPDVFEESGRGVWLMHQLCDLVELRSSEAGTVVRLHMSFD